MNRMPGWLFAILSCALACGAALYLRTALPHAAVFSGDWIKFTGIDAYYYMRLVDNLVPNFPHLTGFDPYNNYPGGATMGNIPVFFVYILAWIIRLAGGAAITQPAMDGIAVYVPALLGALAVIPIYFTAQALTGRWAGLAAAVLAAVLPGEFLGRSLLGNTDHHAFEMLLTALIIMFLALALKDGREFYFKPGLKGGFAAAGRHALFSALAGACLGLYLITWQGAPLFILLLFCYFVIQVISDHLRGFPSDFQTRTPLTLRWWPSVTFYLRGFPADYLVRTAVISTAVALLIFLAFSRDSLTLLALTALALAPAVLYILSSVMSRRGLRRAYYLYAVLGLASAGALLAWLALPEFTFSAARYISSIFFTWRLEQNVVGEMKPLLLPGGFFTLESAWGQFSLAFYSGLAGLALVTYRAAREGRPENLLVAVWSAVFLLATLAMVRFAYYFAACLAVLNGCLVAGIWELAAPRAATATESQRRKRRPARDRPAVSKRAVAAAVLAAAALLCIAAPCASVAVSQAAGPSHAPPDYWLQALDWLRKNSPEPFGDGNYYYRLYDAPAAGRKFEYPATAYSVVAWGDYGYWITRVGHRIPVANTGMPPQGEAGYFSAQSEQAAEAFMREKGARYVITDGRLASINDKFYAVAALNGRPESDFYQLCWQNRDGRYQPLLVFYPDYYRCMLIRLFNFDGRAVTPQAVAVMSYRDSRTADGQPFREITGLKNFRSHAEAEGFAAAQKPGSCSIIGTDPLQSPVPLAALERYRPAYTSGQTMNTGGARQMPAIKIFEYIK